MNSAIVAAPEGAPMDRPMPNELPRAWNFDEIAAAVPPQVPVGRVYMLAWSIIEDERPVRVESCLVLKTTADGRRHLAHLYRRPDEATPKWRVASTHFAGDDPQTRPGLWFIHTKQFETKPTNKQIYASLGPKEVGWKFTLDDSWRFVGCGVCERSRLAAIGEKPTQFFGK